MTGAAGRRFIQRGGFLRASVSREPGGRWRAEVFGPDGDELATFRAWGERDAEEALAALGGLCGADFEEVAW